MSEPNAWILGDEETVANCQHEPDADPYPSLIYVTEEQFAAEPLRMDWAPPRIVPCKHCGAPLDRGRFVGRVSHPALRDPEPWNRPA